MGARSIRGGLWRRLTSWIAAYALVLHSVLIAYGGAAIAKAATPDGAPGFELCLHSPDGADAGGGIPADRANGEAHCKYCIAAGHAVAVAPKPLPHFSSARAATVKLPPRESDLPAAPELSNERPRGPPHQA